MPKFIQRSGVIQHCVGTRAQVELLPLAGCAGCERQRKAGFGSGHCGIDLFGLTGKKNRPILDVFITEQQAARLAPGQSVEVHIPSPNAQWLSAAYRVYGLPTMGLIIGAAMGGFVNEFASIVLSGLGLLAGLWVGRRLTHNSLQSFASLGGPLGRATRIVSVNH